MLSLAREPSRIVYKHLVDVVVPTKHVTTYGAVTTATGVRMNESGGGPLRDALDDLSRACASAKLPPLTAIVVQQGSAWDDDRHGMPGGGYLGAVARYAATGGWPTDPQVARWTAVPRPQDGEEFALRHLVELHQDLVWAYPQPWPILAPVRPLPVLRHLSVRGFRSLKSVDLHDLPQCGVLIGANGSGKSNLLAVLQMVAHISSRSLARFVGEAGGANALAFRGARVSPGIQLSLEFESAAAWYAYEARFRVSGRDRLAFDLERTGVKQPGHRAYDWIAIDSGQFETGLTRKPPAHPTIRAMSRILRHLSYFHVHDTSLTSPMRLASRSRDARYLRSDGSNLAAYVHALKESNDPEDAAAWRRIIGLVRRVAPFIKDLSPAPVEPTPTTLPADLEAEEVLRSDETVLLDWIDEHDDVFGPHHLSDGTLRAIALITALAQPASNRPRIIVIDEPELGLHPAALHLLCGLIRSASAKSQIIVATQSPALLDQYSPDETIVAERADGESRFKRLSSRELAAWLDDYTMSQLFDKNVLGGRP